MDQVLFSQKSNCKNCYKCIRHCPVKAIKFSSDQASIMSDECILCGMCYQVCPQQVKKVRNDVMSVKGAIKQGRAVYASIAPSFITEFPVESFAEMTAVLKKLGFYKVEETAIGAQLVKTEYEKLLDAHQQPVVISSSCPAINNLIETYYPQMLPYLADVLTPMQAHCKYIKEFEPAAFTVFIGPCIAKKREADHSIHTDIALTFEELWEWLEEEGINFSQSKPDPEAGKRAQFFPACGGIIKSMNRRSDIDYVAIDGVETCVIAFEELENSKMDNVFIEMSACEGSCINGPCYVFHKQNRLWDMHRINAYAGAGDYNLQPPPLLQANYKASGTGNAIPTEAEIQQALNQMGKPTPDLELNCGSCGYNTCREKAVAVCQGKADFTMCLPYLKEKAESFSDSIIGNMPEGVLVLDEKLLIQDMNKAACQLFNRESPKDLLNRHIMTLFEADDYQQVAQTGQSVHNHHRYLEHYDKYIEETIIYDKTYHIIVALIRDITSKEKTEMESREVRENAAQIADKVIEKQMRIVQDIASLLGETTAETKVALTKLKDSLQQ